MSDSILDEFEPHESLDTRWGAKRGRFAGSTCCGHTRTGRACHRIGFIIRDNHSYCQDHDPGPEAA